MGSGAQVDVNDYPEDTELNFPELDHKLFIQNNIRVAQENGYSSLPASKASRGQSSILHNCKQRYKPMTNYNRSRPQNTADRKHRKLAARDRVMATLRLQKERQDLCDDAIAQ